MLEAGGEICCARTGGLHDKNVSSRKQTKAMRFIEFSVPKCSRPIPVGSLASILGTIHTYTRNYMRHTRSGLTGKFCRSNPFFRQLPFHDLAFDLRREPIGLSRWPRDSQAVGHA